MPVDSMYCTIKYLTNEKNCIAQQIRKKCGGVIYEHQLTGDLLIDFIGYKLSRCYPCLLLAKNNLEWIDFSNLEKEYLKKIIENDDISKLVNRNKNGDERFAFALTKTGQESSIICVSDITSYFSNIITNSFNNCEYRLDITIDTVFQEVCNAIKVLRKIALKRNITYSFFTGMKGIVFDGFTKIELLLQIRIKIIYLELLLKQDIN